MTPSLTAVSAAEFTDEAELVQRLAGRAAYFYDHYPAIRAEAETLVKALRASGKKSQVEAFLHEYGLETPEGVAILCLAEALLRIPDADTADALIRGTLKDAAWTQHLGHSESLWVNASTWGLMLTGGIVHLGALTQGGVGRMLGKLASRLGEPVIREALKAGMKLIGGQFVLGETIEQALRHAEGPWRYSYDLLGEAARTDSQAEHYAKAYAHAIARLAGHGKGSMTERDSISIKLSALHPRYELAKGAAMLDELGARLKPLLLGAREAGLMVTLDAEESYRLDISLQLIERLMRDPDFAGWNGLGLAVQAYQTRATYVLSWLAELAGETRRRIPVRLVKGAYWDAEIKRAQVLGLPGYPVFTRKEATDASYLACAKLIAERGEAFYPQFATHNALTMASIRHLMRHLAPDTPYEFQRLHGMGEGLYQAAGHDIPCRVYAPVGPHKDLLAYLIRRLLENGANTSFVHLLVDTQTPMETLLADPLRKLRDYTPGIALPRDIYADRRNSSGIDLGNAAALETLLKRISPAFPKLEAAPVIGGKTGKGEASLPVRNPATLEAIGACRRASDEDVERAITVAHEAFEAWNAISAETRAKMLERAADLLESRREHFVGLLAREGGRTLSDGIAELREAADMCRYYAMQARRLFGAPQPLRGPTGEYNALSLHGRGVFACISPWNFPLAIFTGQIAAALASGNTVIAKPAEETPITASETVQLLREAGIPAHVLHLLPGDGAVGHALVSDPRIAGVAFTGSTEVAWKINRALAAREAPIAPLIAETGGQNAMIVDSSALLEQAVDDILLSAFGSAGQRCSSLRVLYVQRDVAEELIALLKGAMARLQLGDPRDPATDIGPVITREAREKLFAHLARMNQEATPLASTPSWRGAERRGHPDGESGWMAASPSAPRHDGYFVEPHVFELKHIGQLQGEVFGPVLHLIRYDSEDLAKVIADINATGFGLTFGIHSRLVERARGIADQVRVGNAYINRGMTGAVVGVQPFGGEGLSGTGPKAGGPHYLLRFASERTLTLNTAAIGGNLELLKGG